MELFVKAKNRIKRFIDKRKKDIPYWIDIQKRKYTSIFNYERLAQDIPELITKEYPYNAYYGIADLVKKEKGIPKRQRLEAAVEHGVGDYSQDLWDALLSQKKIYVFGSARDELLRKLHPDKELIHHKNFMAYVKSAYGPIRTKFEKMRFGKTLLCFPTHSTHHVVDRFDQTPLIQEIEKIRIEHNFDTVLVSVYWKDIHEGRHLPYIDAGYKIVTMGHIYDNCFLRRLKAVLSISDMVITNDVGSHIGYAIHECVPVYQFFVPIEHVALDEEVDFSIYGMTDSHQVFSKECTSLFGTYSEEITEAQREFVRLNWGEF